MKILVAYASKHGATAEIAAAIAGELTGRGHETDLRDASDVRSVATYDAVVLGSAIYYGHWLAAAHGLVSELGAQLRIRAVWAFSSGRVAGHPEVDMDEAHVAWVLAQSGAREHRSFAGRLAGDELDWRERVATRAIHAQPGDYRDWAQIASWAGAIATELGTNGPARRSVRRTRLIA